MVHPPGHAQVDFGEAIGIIGGIERKIHFFAFDLPHSDACFVVCYPAETTEAFCDGHIRAFAFFGGVPKSILYDNTKIAVGRILGDGKRQRTRVFAELQSHYLFEDRFGRPGKGNDKGKVEGLVGYARRNFLVPIPVFETFAALNDYLLECCRRRMADCLRGHDVTIGERLERDLAALRTPLPAPYDACEKIAAVEMFIFTRAYLFERIYQHPKIRAAECLLARSLDQYRQRAKDTLTATKGFAEFVYHSGGDDYCIGVMTDRERAGQIATLANRRLPRRVLAVAPRFSVGYDAVRRDWSGLLRMAWEKALTNIPTNVGDLEQTIAQLTGASGSVFLDMPRKSALKGNPELYVRRPFGAVTDTPEEIGRYFDAAQFSAAYENVRALR